jgi:hypothetical protein
MKNAFTILLLIASLALSPKAFAEERWRIYDNKGRYEGTVRKNDDERMKMYDQKGRHERTFREDHGGRIKMYDQKGRFEGSVHQDDDLKRCYQHKRDP